CVPRVAELAAPLATLVLTWSNTLPRPSRVAGLAVRVATLVLTRANVLRTTPRVWRPVAAPASGSWSRSPTQVPACPTPNWPAFWGSAAPRCVITATPCGVPGTRSTPPSNPPCPRPPHCGGRPPAPAGEPLPVTHGNQCLRAGSRATPCPCPPRPDNGGAVSTHPPQLVAVPRPRGADQGRHPTHGWRP